LEGEEEVEGAVWSAALRACSCSGFGDGSSQTLPAVSCSRIHTERTGWISAMKGRVAFANWWVDIYKSLANPKIRTAACDRYEQGCFP
jgi:hypothetical protein